MYGFGAGLSLAFQRKRYFKSAGTLPIDRYAAIGRKRVSPTASGSRILGTPAIGSRPGNRYKTVYHIAGIAVRSGTRAWEYRQADLPSGAAVTFSFTALKLLGPEERWIFGAYSEGLTG
jgi:hypothetical protein